MASKKVMFGKKHEETESSDEDQSIEGKQAVLLTRFDRIVARARSQDTRSQGRT